MMLLLSSEPELESIYPDGIVSVTPAFTVSVSPDNIVNDVVVPYPSVLTSVLDDIDPERAMVPEFERVPPPKLENTAVGNMCLMVPKLLITCSLEISPELLIAPEPVMVIILKLFIKPLLLIGPKEEMKLDAGVLIIVP